MVSQRDVLTLVAKRSTERRPMTAQDLARAFGLSLTGAGQHLKRLWQERLIVTVSGRLPRFRFRLEPGEAIMPLRFVLTSRGRERLRWYERQDGDDDDLFGLSR